ncbi:hypothetical protein MNBD_GAMMA11-1724 [hydrothermal vent metagenome]|uniref:Uncharacterized protein n=1 Tax=hydrothermal vent metagenome TaxID=652676 RepID=A0A3B0X3J6_9ZZZZ
MLISPRLYAIEVPPWGTAGIENIKYASSKVVYDVTTGDEKALSDILSRVGLLYKLQGSDVFEGSVIVVIHGDAIPFFATNQFEKYKNLMYRANSLTVGTSVEFRMCNAAAKLLNYEAKDIHGFVKMVPMMADAEIARLQHDGYSYIH